MVSKKLPVWTIFDDFFKILFAAAFKNTFIMTAQLSKSEILLNLCIITEH
jgi:hypothetical protein